MIGVASMLPLVFLGCSNNSGGSDAGSDATTDAGVDVIIDPQNCVAPGTKPNDQGMGGYCSPGGGQCDTAGPGGAPRICTADVAGTPAHAWFCTYPCDPTTNCGTGATCLGDSMGNGCVPTACDYLAGDAGVDAGSDASSDATSDAPSDAPEGG